MSESNVLEDKYLTGGVFLSLVLDSIQTKNKEGRDKKISRKDFMDAFKTVVNPNAKKNEHRNYSSDISKYLTCRDPGVGQVGLSAFCEGDILDRELHDKNKYGDVRKRVEIFITDWIDPAKSELLVRRLLYVLSKDSNAEDDMRFAHPDGTVVTKDVLLNNCQFKLADFFLVMIWFCIIKRAKQNVSGRKTFLSMFEKTGMNWVYSYDIGDDFSKIHVSMPEADDKTSDEIISVQDESSIESPKKSENSNELIDSDNRTREESKVNLNLDDWTLADLCVFLGKLLDRYPGIKVIKSEPESVIDEFDGEEMLVSNYNFVIKIPEYQGVVDAGNDLGISLREFIVKYENMKQILSPTAQNVMSERILKALHSNNLYLQKLSAADGDNFVYCSEFGLATQELEVE